MLMTFLPGESDLSCLAAIAFSRFERPRFNPEDGNPRAVKLSMQSNSLADETTLGLPFHPGERRKNPRFDMHFPVFLRKPAIPGRSARPPT